MRLRISVLMLLASVALPTAARDSNSPAVAARVRIVRAEFGPFRPDGTLLPGTTVPRAVDQAYGWRMNLNTRLTSVRVREELTLPAEPATWGDPEPGLKRKVSADGRTALTELTLELRAGQVSQAWAVAPGDPKGEYLLKVKVEGAPEQVFRFRVQ
jgi:hypothetical protein